MRIIFAGTPENAAETLTGLVEAGIEVVGVLTRKDASVGRKRTIESSAVAKVAEVNGIALMKANSINDEVRSWLVELAPDIGVIVAYGVLLKASELAIPSRGWLNLHYSLLPDLPGASPVQTAILEGRTSTGVTVFQLDEGLDTGPILANQRVSIKEDANSAMLLEELTAVGTGLLIETLKDIDNRLEDAKPQSVPANRTMATKIHREDAKISFTEPAASVHNLVLAMNPEPMAWFEVDGSPIRIIEAKLTDQEALVSGQITVDGSQVLAGCKDFAIELVLVQPAGKSQLKAIDWFRGVRSQIVKAD